MNDHKIRCAVCKKRPHGIAEYVEASIGHLLDSVDDYITQEEGTFNPSNNLFTCTDCYVKIGMPSGRNGWRPRGFYFQSADGTWCVWDKRIGDIERRDPRVYG